MPPLKIAIVGAGPAGCTLALILHNAGIDVSIYEGEASPDFRNQGGTLDLHEETGLLAMKRAGVWDAFTKQCRYDGEAMVCCNKYLRRYLNLGGSTADSSRGRPEIDRSALRQLLCSALPPNMIKWNHRLRHVDSSDPANLTLSFHSGATVSGFSLLVGADGAWSKVRPLLTTMRPFYAGMSIVRFTIPSIAEHPDLNALINRGSVFAFSDGKAITAQQIGDGTCSVSANRLTPEDFIKSPPFDPQDGKAAKAHALADFADWDPRLRKLIEVSSDEEPWYGNIYSLTPGARWAHRPGVTLVGDAAHVLVPWAGEGVNLSLQDSVKLADAIITANQTAGEKGSVSAETVSREVRKYEEDMFVRAEKTSRLSLDMMNCMFYETGAPDLTIERYVTLAVSDAAPWWAVGILGYAVRTYYAWFRWWYPGLGDIHTKKVA
ncbi:FAD-binding domain-containing protein 16 [Elsinoe fawcettii]|nr:FAD-binding domain-containing protein 16 [Elsinoe fawcettii]